ncbi:hypothetical protein [Desulfosporosinus burensis]
MARVFRLAQVTGTALMTTTMTAFEKISNQLTHAVSIYRLFVAVERYLTSKSLLTS